VKITGLNKNYSSVKKWQVPHAVLRTIACGSLSFPKNYVFVLYFLFLLPSVEILQNGTVVASMPYSRGVQPCSTTGPNAYNQIGSRATAACVKLRV